MRNDSNIVSFEDAKRSVRGRFVSNKEQPHTSLVGAASSSAEHGERPRDRDAASATTSKRRGMRAASASGKHAGGRIAAPSRNSGESGRITGRLGKEGDSRSGVDKAARTAGASRSRSSQVREAGLRGMAKASITKTSVSDDARDVSRDEEPELSLKEAKRRARNKAKADRKFDKMYGDTSESEKGKGLLGRLSRKGSNASSDDSAGPRAAVYKGEMGAKHRKAAAMQSGRPGGGFSLRLPFGFGNAKRESAAVDERGLDGSFPTPKVGIGRTGRIALRTGVAAICVIVFCAAIYAPAQQCYVQIRERDRLAAEYEAVMQRNEILNGNVETLQSNAGVEDLAHSSFGLVKEGENAGSVTGVDIKDKSTFTAKIIPGSVPAPDTWYSDALDWLFGYSAD